MSRDEVFEEHRPLLFSIAYRMLGSVMDAEDVVQEAFVRWRGAGEVRSPRAYLSSVVTRLCIDQLRSARARREEYAGPWLPEPLAAEPAADPAVLDETLSMAFLVLLESLSPVERAVFLLREVFDYGYAEIAEIVGKSEANCRQIARRARQSVAARRPRFDVSPGEGERLVRRFVEASMSGDMEGLLQVISEDITLWTDGGGRVRAARNPIHGADRVARFLLGVIPEAPEGLEIRYARVNGQPGIVSYYADGTAQGAAAFDISGGRIRAVRYVINPEKLRGIPPLLRRSSDDPEEEGPS
ncbi:RNA polymerase, sigma-24 subunit, ECF subfamily [Rubrobacter xylanophilus DSM 9941]|uniref:RNA polymerase, sigma-24 subunit, ECF subfamily n=1 Tax=Rubrobacter xylanophilus (strain DSM 9941 / JCM 11954 / NBRC 16129 / PRD-1) TaxID=266117 RepID=Q1ATI5_RUBXD|nr:RNA polymerase sigma-70 factor [Rubrobacter xylanophilus]ABG05293.1 RNA polymerase, sigma-24 subunit, ECF subfamily [Rubrobacter xylanophilus DSM 9941]